MVAHKNVLLLSVMGLLIEIPVMYGRQEEKNVCPETADFKDQVPSLYRRLQKRPYKQGQQPEHEEQENQKAVYTEEKPENLPEQHHF